MTGCTTEVEVLAAAIGRGDNHGRDLAADRRGRRDGRRGTLTKRTARGSGAPRTRGGPGGTGSYPCWPSSARVRRPAPARSIQIDELTGFLILADLLLPAVASEPPATADAEPPLAAGPDLPSPLAVGHGLQAVIRTAAGPCDQIASRNQRNGWDVGQLAQALAGGVHRGMQLSSYLHAFLMNAMVEARVRNEDFHMAHDTTSQAAPRHQVVTFSLRINPGPQAVECGLLRAALLGIQGGIVSMPVTWSYGSMERFADPICSSATCATTDATGTVTLTTVPKAEPQPAGIGPEVHETVQLAATGDVLQALGPDLWSRLPGTPVKKVAQVDVDVAYHRAYDLFVHIDSTIKVIQENPAVDNGLIATAHAEGDLDIKTACDRNGRPPSCSKSIP
jgi:hypothetical protein